jgi:putative tricarboxylic transport membrane protein
MRGVALRDGDVLSGAALSALGIFIILEASKWTYSGPDGPGPGFFPIWYGVGLVALSLWLVVAKLLRPSTDPGEPVDWWGVGRAIGTWASFTVAVALLQPLGFVLSFALLSFYMIAVVFRRGLLTAALTAVVLAAGFYLLFPVALGIQLPTGPFGVF